MVDILTDPVCFETEWRKAQEAEQDDLSPKQARLEVVSELIAHCEQEAAETAEALKQARGLVLEKLQASIDGLDDRYTKLTTERDRPIADLEAGSRLYLELLQVTATVKDG